MKKIVLSFIALISIYSFSHAQSALNFDGQDDNVTTIAPVTFATTNVTMEAWVNWQSGGANLQSVIYNGNAGNSGYGLIMYFGSLNLLLGGVQLDSVGTIPTNTWTHLALVNDGAQWIVYINGESTFTSASTANPLNGGNTTFIGCNTSAEIFNGSIDEVRIWGVARTQTEIQNNMNCAISGSATNLLANYHFNDGTPNADNTNGHTTLFDDSGNNNNATLTNFTLNGTSSNWVDNITMLNPIASATITSNAPTFFAGQNVDFTATPSNGGASPSYQWMVNGVNAGTNSFTYSTGTLNPTDTVTCMMTSSYSCAINNLSNKLTTSSLIAAGSYPIFAMQSGNNTNDELYVLDSTDFNVQYTIPLHGSLGEVVIGNTGLTTSKSGQLYGLLKLQSSGTKYLATINPNDSSATMIANSINFAGIAFAGDSLFGVTGSNGGGSNNAYGTPSSLYKIDPSTGDTTFIVSFINQYGQTLAYCNDNNSLYQFGGYRLSDGGIPQITRINPHYPYDTTTVIPSGYDWGEVLSVIYIGGGKFVMQTWGEMAIVDTNGVATLTPYNYNNVYKGMTFPKYLITRTGAATICANDSSLLSATTPGDAYQWYKGSVAINGATNANYYAKTTGTYNCKITIAGVPHMAAAAYSVAVNPLPVVTISGANGFCIGSSITLTGTAGGTIQWYKDGSAIPSANSNTLFVNEVGTYNMTKTNNNGCTDSAVVGKTVTQYSLPSASISASSTTLCAGVQDTLVSTVLGGSGVYTNYIWSPGTHANSASAFFTPSSAGVKKWKLKVTDSHGCSSPFDSVMVTALATSTGDTTVIACDSFTWNNVTYTSSPSVAPTITLTNAVGCDSVVTLHLTINNSTIGDTTVVACDSFTWNNVMYTSTPNVDPMITLTNAIGCDSVVTLHLTINNSTMGDTTVVACDSFTWNNFTYTSTPSVDPMIMLTNAMGCDSVVTLHLTINNSTMGDTTVVACDSFTWNNITYTSTPSVDPMITLTNANGCDSIVTLHLTINNSTMGDTTVVACNSYTWNNVTYTSSPSIAPTMTLTNAMGCDSIVTLYLTFNSNTGDTTVVACGRYTWDNITYTSTPSVDPIMTLTNALGCDSVVTLHLTIDNADLTTTLVNDTITANQNGAMYQWVDCSTNMGINGETNQSYIATISGDYAVVVTNGACSDTSACVNVIVTGAKQLAINGNQLSVYPNPSNGMFTVNVNGIKSLKVFNALGEIVYNSTDFKSTVDITNQTSGVYMLQVITTSGTTQHRIVKQ